MSHCKCGAICQAAYPTLTKSYSLDIKKKRIANSFQRPFICQELFMLIIILSSGLQSYPHFTAIGTTPSGKGVRILSTMMVLRAGTEGGIE